MVFIYIYKHHEYEEQPLDLFKGDESRDICQLNQITMRTSFYCHNIIHMSTVQ